MTFRPRLVTLLTAGALLTVPSAHAWADDELVGKPGSSDESETEASASEAETEPANDEGKDDESASDDADDDAAESETEAPEPSKKDDAVASKKTRTATDYPDRRATSGLGLELRLGGLATLRRMTFQGTEDTILHTPSPYVGGVLQVSQHILTWGDANADLLVEGEGGFGSARDSEVEPAIGRPLITEYVYAYASAVVEKPLSPSLDLRIGLGGGGKSFTVEPNPDYTGHRYLSLLASFSVTKWLASKWRFSGGLTFFPGIDTNQSARDYGSARSFGARAEAGAVWRFYQPEENDLFGTAELSTRFTYTRFRTAMPETQVVGDLSGTDDSHQQLVLMLGYYL